MCPVEPLPALASADPIARKYGHMVYFQSQS